jgi:hypothetical protein
MTVAGINCRMLYKDFIRRRCNRYGKFIGAGANLKVILKKARCPLGPPPQASPVLGAASRRNGRPKTCYLGHRATAARIISNRFA